MNDLPEGHTRLIDGVCDEFEREYRAGRCPPIEAYLPRVPPPQRPYLLGELLGMEIDYRLQRGERPGAPEYQRRFPGADAVIAATFARLPARPRSPAAAVPATPTVSAVPATPTVSAVSAAPVAPSRQPSSARAMPAPGWALTLTVAEGPQRGQVFTCAGRGAFLVGRSRHAHLSLADPHLSRSHFLLELDPPRCRLTELGSRNQTQVNNQAVAPDKSLDLRDGDVIRAGQTVLRVSLAGRGGVPDASDEPVTLVLGGAAGPGTQERDETLDPTGRSLPPAGVYPALTGYRIEKELGRGGMGVVYLGVRASDGARVAVKTIIPVVKVAPGQVQRFVREANILRQLDHPNIVSFYEAGEVAGVLYLAMSYVEGTDAGRMLKEQGALPAKTAIRMTCQLLSALEYAHGKDFVHRDIKPANLLVEEDGGKRTVKLADFGLARVYQESRMSGLTIEGDVGGTVAFMPPEQITDFRQTKPAADQYAAAATLYNLLTGHLLFDFEKNKGSSLDKVLREQPVPISQRRPDLPPDLAPVIHRALAKDPEQRFPDVRTFRAALKAFA